jgi:hypothetical protein
MRLLLVLMLLPPLLLGDDFIAMAMDSWMDRRKE